MPDFLIANVGPNEIDLLNSARRQAALEPYNAQYDIAETVLQFGSLVLFSFVSAYLDRLSCQQTIT